MCVCVCKMIHIRHGAPPAACAALLPGELIRWPLQGIRSLQSNLPLFNHPCIAPSICIAHTIAILSDDY